MDAGELLQGLVGQTIHTISGQPNRVLSIQDDAVIVGTQKSELGEPVPIEWVQNALDRLSVKRQIEINPDSVGYRSAFIGAVLLTLPIPKLNGAPHE